MKKVVILGPTGSGKSALSNILLGAYQFEESARIHSHTTLSEAKDGKWRGVGQEICIIDTQGHGDSEGRDSDHIQQMVACLKQQEIIHTFILLFNGQNPRFDESLCSMLTTFVGIFGPLFLRHTILGFSNWAFDVASERRRRETGLSEFTRANSFADHFRKQFGLDFNIPSFFYEREYATLCHSEEECTKFEGQLEILESFVMQSTPCDMRGISVILAEKDRLRREAEDLRRKVAELEAEKSHQVEMERQRVHEYQSFQVSTPTHSPPVPGVYYIYSVHDPNLVLDIQSNSTNPHAPLIVYPFHGGANQQFEIRADGTIKAMHSGHALELPSSEKSKRVVQNYHTASVHQRWEFCEDGAIGLAGTNLVFAIEQGLKIPRAKVIGWTKNGGTNQKWKLVKVK